jgi:hypothetical protein
LDSVEVADRGDLAGALRATLAGRAGSDADVVVRHLD